MLQYDVFADEDFDPRRRLPVPATSIKISTGPGRSELTLLSILILHFLTTITIRDNAPNGCSQIGGS